MEYFLTEEAVFECLVAFEIVECSPEITTLFPDGVEVAIAFDFQNSRIKSSCDTQTFFNQALSIVVFILFKKHYTPTQTHYRLSILIVGLFVKPLGRIVICKGLLEILFIQVAARDFGESLRL